MKVLNFGSLNIDHVYRVPHTVQPGETLAAANYQCFAGGKGLNQSVALARAQTGIEILHAGMIGIEGIFLKELLEGEGVNCENISISHTIPTGQALIQVADNGENSIVLFGGANQAIPTTAVATALNRLSAGDFVVLQNEISVTPDVIRQAAKRQMRVFFNPAPMGPEVFSYPLEYVDTLILNETEAIALQEQIPLACKHCNLLLTLGSRGACYQPAGGEQKIKIAAVPVEKVVDTTAAGDTFMGYFVAALAARMELQAALELSARAAAVTVSRPGAAASIPHRTELLVRDCR
ncbi:MAG: ribokinase [Lentisphaeria bacterium]